LEKRKIINFLISSFTFSFKGLLVTFDKIGSCLSWVFAGWTSLGSRVLLSASTEILGLTTPNATLCGLSAAD